MIVLFKKNGRQTRFIADLGKMEKATLEKKHIELKQKKQKKQNIKSGNQNEG